MFNKASSALTALLFLQQWSSSNAQSSTSTSDQSTTTACPTNGGAHIIVSRGSLEAAPYGTLVTVKDLIVAALPGSTADGTIGYPDTLADYQDSETDGVIVAKSLIMNYTTNCPGLPLVVMGYSQGAQVLGDALVGQDDFGFNDNTTVDEPLSNTILNQVAAVILMGDPSFVVNETFHVGNATKDGVFPRENVANWDNAGLASRTQSYCDANDLFCASGTSLAVHVGYVPEYGTVAAAYVVSAIEAWYASQGTSTASASASASKAPIASASASKSASASASKASASKAASASASASGTGYAKIASASASASVVTATVSASATTAAATATANAAASGIEFGAAAVVVGVVAALL